MSHSKLQRLEKIEAASKALMAKLNPGERPRPYEWGEREALREALRENPPSDIPTSSTHPTVVTLRTLLAEATSGPWRVAHHGTTEVEAEPNQVVADCGSVGKHEADAKLIATAINALPGLLDQLEARHAELRANFKARAEAAGDPGPGHLTGGTIRPEPNLSYMRVMTDRLWSTDPWQWGIWECSGSSNEPMVRLSGPIDSRNAAIEMAEILADAIGRLTGTPPELRTDERP